MGAMGPWPACAVAGNTELTTKHYVQPANRGEDPWKDWAHEVRNPARIQGCVKLVFKAGASLRQCAALMPGDSSGIPPPQDGIDHISGQSLRTLI